MDDHSMGVVEPTIAVHDLVKTYKTGTAVAGISFALVPGSITGLLGGNGAGKTTTIAMIMGLVAPTSGAVRVLSADMPPEKVNVCTAGLRKTGRISIGIKVRLSAPMMTSVSAITVTA